jgi:hypothetical protein
MTRMTFQATATRAGAGRSHPGSGTLIAATVVEPLADSIISMTVVGTLLPKPVRRYPFCLAVDCSISKALGARTGEKRSQPHPSVTQAETTDRTLALGFCKGASITTRAINWMTKVIFVDALVEYPKGNFMAS